MVQGVKRKVGTADTHCVLAEDALKHECKVLRKHSQICSTPYMHQEQTIFTLHFWEICLLDSLMAEEEALVSFCISLPSGQSTTISLPAGSTVAALKEAAQEAFQQGWLRLATADGRLLDPQKKWIKNCFPFPLLLFSLDVCMAGAVLQCMVTSV